ncbi:MAG: hypothetical protein IPK82_14450 [Polyangiaceae bacterium]|nr:hypothetical protein [Polyangiaceae bacterium]
MDVRSFGRHPQTLLTHRVSSMRVGIVAEGRGDLAVITNILKGALAIQSEDIQYIRPEYYLDETDLHHQRSEQFGNCALVRDECQTGTRLQAFLDSPVDDEGAPRILVIHVDTGEIGRADAVIQVQRPTKPTNVKRPQKQAKKSQRANDNAEVAQYSDEVVTRVSEQIRQWLGPNLTVHARFAVAVEETEAWLLALHNNASTDILPDPKAYLLRWLQQTNDFTAKDKSRLSQMREFDRADQLSKGFRNKKTLHAATQNNHSLAIFVESLPENDKSD